MFGDLFLRPALASVGIILIGVLLYMTGSTFDI
jgi:hypothetical protein